jgi:putative heme iron utilization protein
MNSDHAEAAGIYARHYCGAKDGDWTIVGLDAAGIDLASGDKLKRLEYSRELDQASELRGELARLLREARAVD